MTEVEGASPQAPPRRSLGYWVRHHLGWSLALLVLVTALAVALLRLALPALDLFRADLQQWATAELGTPVRLGGIGAEWRGWRPVLRLEGVQLLDRAGEPFLGLDALLVEVDPLESLRQAALRPDHLIIRGAEITVQRDAAGSFSLCCLGERRAGAAGAPDVAHWLRRESLLEVEDSTLHLRDHSRGGVTYSFTAIQAVLVNHPDGSWLRGQAAPPAELGAGLTFAIDLGGDAGAMDTARIYVEGRGLRMAAPPLSPMLPEGLSVGGGTLDTRLWLDWHEGRITRAHATGTIRDLAMALDGHALPAAGFGIEATFRNQDDPGWRSSGRLTALDGGILTSGGRAIRFEVSGSGTTTTRLALATERVDLAAVRPYLRAVAAGDSDEAPQPTLRGTVEDIALAFAPEDVMGSLELRARVAGAGMSRHGSLPGIRGIHGRLAMAGGRLRAILPGKPLEVDASHLFREPLRVDTLAGEVWATREAGQWSMHVDDIRLRNPDIRLWLTGRIDLPANGAPYLNLVGTFDDSRLERVSAYLPATVMADDAVRWIDRGLVSGRIHDGTLVIQGRTDAFPWEDGSGHLEVRAQLEQGIIDYKPQWPRLEEIEAEAVFVGRSMTIHGSSAKILGSDLRDVRAHSPNLDADDVLLEIAGDVTGPGQDGMRILLETPMKDRFEDHFGGAAVTGNVTMDLDFDILLRSGDVVLDGNIHFDGNDLTLPLLDMPLVDTTGRLHITDVGLDGTDLHGSLNDIPVRLDIETMKDPAEEVTRVSLTGPLTAATLRREDVPWAGRANGETTWQATVDIPNDIHDGPPTRLWATSDLRGLAIDLPAPLGKAAASARPLAVRADLDSENGRRRLDITLGNDLRAEVTLAGGGETMVVEGAHVRIGPGPVTTTDIPGLYITGTLPELDADGWVPRVMEVTAGPADPGAGRLDFAGLDLTTSRLLALGQAFEDARVVVGAPAGGHLPVTIAAAGLAGTLEVPVDGSDALVRGELERLYLTRDEDGTEEDVIDPRDIPPLEVTCADCRLGDLELGRVELTTRSLRDGLEIRRLDTVTDGLEMDITGRWIMESSGRPRSLIKAQVETNDLGDFLKRLGYQKSGIAEGKAKARLEATWAGPPTEFDLARSTGELEVTIRNGRLEDVDPGAGRFFGLLSINALPRRLLLDFRDLFEKGLSFDKLEGSFTIDEGDAYTNNLTMNAPAARVDVAGRVGLATEDYDEIVTVTPKVSSTLPVAGAIAGGPIGAAIGVAAAYISSNIMGKEVGGVIKTQYAITGSWEAPEIVKLGEEEDGEPGEEPEFDIDE
ncbi:MAG: YhdP family protein [Gammaproteobacteria bacterium]|nr:YhdP family protein [Gammaproteobacteria bacterium]